MTDNVTKKKMPEKAIEIPDLTPQEVWDVVNFARAYYGGQFGSIYGTNYLNPELVSGRMKDITLNPMAASEALLNTAMTDPKNSEKQLQQFSQSFEVTSMVYKRLLSYLSNMLSFDITYTSSVKPEEYDTLKYRKDRDAVDTFLDRFEFKKEFRIVVREMLRNDAYFGCMRDVGDKLILQELPSEYCKITGRWGNGFVFSFNMYWFLQPGVDIDMYPPFFKKKYKDMFVNPKLKDYNPSLPPELRANSTWIYWVDVPVDVGMCFKLTPELATRLPYFTPLFNDLVLQGQMRNLQKNMNIAAASKMIMGQVPMLNKDTKATVKDSIAISPDLLGKFLALVKSGMSEAIKLGAAPLEEIEPISFETDNAMYDSYLRTALASSGINTNLIFSSSVKPNAIETQLSLNVDEQMMCALYDQFNDFMVYHANKYTRAFKFLFYFEGTDFFLNREARMTVVNDMLEKGIVMPQKIAAAMGMKPSQLRKYMEEAAGTGFIDLLTPPAFAQQKELLDMQNEQANTMADKQAEQQEVITEKQGIQQEKIASMKVTTAGVPKPASSSTASKGRPKKPVSKLGDEGLATRAGATNVGRGGKS